MSSAGHHLLIVADESCGRPELCRAVRARAVAGTAVLVVSPVKASAGWVTDDEDARRAARERLRATLACLERIGVSAKGHLADADAVQAIDDALSEFPADEVLFFTGPDEDSWWLHRDVVERAHHRFRLPVAQIVLNPRPEVAAL